MLAFRRAIAAVVALGTFCATIAPATAFAARSGDIRDLGRRNAAMPVRVSLLLNYNHQAELDALVRSQGERRSPLFRRFLSPAQFDGYFAPTPAQESQVIMALRRSGFTITKTFPNRILIDAQAPSAAVERFFGTEIHTVQQFHDGRSLGLHYMNVRPGTVPAIIAPLVKTISLDDLITAFTPPVSRHVIPMSRVLPPRPRVAANVVLDPNFSSPPSLFGPWYLCGSVAAYVTTTHPFTGGYDEYSGTKTGSGEPNGDSSVCQKVVVPASGVLTVEVFQLSNEASTSNSWQEGYLLNSSGKIIATLYKSVNNVAGWVQDSWNLSAYAGQTLYLEFGVHGNGSTVLYTQQYLDSVSLTSGSGPAPTPMPSATPTAAPTPSGCTGAAALNGPLSVPFSGFPNQWVATGVAKAFDFPVQHGCNGTGVTVGIVIDSPVSQADINGYLSAAGVTETGSITNVAVDGGGTYVSGGDSVEAALDAETIIGLAPGVAIDVFNIPALSDQDIEDAYNTAVAAHVTAVNSSFGGCEAADPTGAAATNAIAQGAAATGTTFEASSGDNGSAGGCVSTPASGPYVVGVGAVKFTSNATTGALASITSGMDPTCSTNPCPGFSSGGGVSTQFLRPTYQTGITGILTGTSGAHGTTAYRNVPDLSEPGVDVLVIEDGLEYAEDGTSWSCPIFTALIAEASQLKGTKFGYVLPSAYTLFNNSYANGDYTDVTTGKNGLYTAKADYDQITGIGAPEGWKWASAI